jgi:tetratricopeptide (TPR) repeat protein
METPEQEPVAKPRFAGDARASLEAVKTAQSAARARARRETRWARALTLGALMAMGVTAWAAAHRPAKAPAPEKPVVAPPVAPTLAPDPIEAPPVAAPAPAPTLPVDAEDRVAKCDAASEQRDWPAVASTCAAAFEARPGDAALAMRIAQAEHRRGHVAVAADWARKALALDASLPEAYVLVGRAAVAAGDTRAAADAYRRYLDLAPRGWHAAEARRALR